MRDGMTPGDGQPEKLDRARGAADGNVEVLSDEKAMAVIESLLFTMGRAVAAQDLARVLHTDPGRAADLARRLGNLCIEEGRGVRVIELEDSFQMCTDPEMYDYINALIHQPKKYSLTNVMLETLAIIAYMQPVTRAQIAKIRGVSCTHPVNRLLDYGLIMEAGRLDAPGRPILFATTEEFLRAFGVSRPAELPPVPPALMEEFKGEAEKEAEDTIGV